MNEVKNLLNVKWGMDINETDIDIIKENYITTITTTTTTTSATTNKSSSSGSSHVRFDYIKFIRDHHPPLRSVEVEEGESV